MSSQDYLLTLKDLSTNSIGNIETLFAQANGFIGVRASYPVLTEDSTPGSFVNGFFESHNIIYGENAYGYAKSHETMVKLFDFRSISIIVGNEHFMSLISEDRQLDMKKGILSESFIYQSLSGRQILIELESFTSHKDRTVYAQKWKIKALNFSDIIFVKQSAHHIKINSESQFDPRIREASVELVFDSNSFSTINSKQVLFFEFPTINKEFELVEGNSISFTQLYRLSKENHFSTLDYEELKEEQIKIFEQFWKSSDVILDGDKNLQKGIRFNLYHLFNSAGRDGISNFGAKGLTGEGYEGHYFWDTEMYILPFFIFTQPEIAKQLLRYRLSKLRLARERAYELGFKGVLFPWRGISGNETSAYYPAGTAQFHINADIAYAFSLYDKVTGDREFILESRELIFETARFWMSFGFFSERGFEIHEVTGPDEYTALVNNNYYTNKMVQHNLNYAVELANRFNECNKEKLEWQRAADSIVLGYDEIRQLTKQDDSFLDKEVWDFENTSNESYPLLLHFHPIKIYKHQVLKQADTLLAHVLFPIDKEQEERDYNYYEPLTTHDSSLSKAIYGIIASRLGKSDEALDFFSSSAIMDLEDSQGNASHGIHAANMAGSWLGLVYGFAGLRIENGELRISNFLPKNIKRLSFNITLKGVRKNIVIEQEKGNV